MSRRRLLCVAVLSLGATSDSRNDEVERKAAVEQARATLAQAEQNPSPELYQRAAELFEKAHLVGMAIQIRQRLLMQFPASRRATLELARS